MSKNNKSVSPPKKEDPKDKKKSSPSDKKGGKKTNEKIKIKLSIPEDKIEEYKDSFDYFDREKNGFITIQELKGLLHSLGRKTEEANVKQYIDEMDQNGDGKVDFEEYISIIEKYDAGENNVVDDTDDDIIKAFKVFDVQNKGYINAGEFKHILKHLGDEDNRFTDDEIRQVFKEADIEGKPKINYYEFVEFWKSK